MIVPSPVEFATVPNGGVYSQDMVGFLIKTGADSATSLNDGSAATGISPTAPVSYFPNARLVLG